MSPFSNLIATRVMYFSAFTEQQLKGQMLKTSGGDVLAYFLI